MLCLGFWYSMLDIPGVYHLVCMFVLVGLGFLLVYYRIVPMHDEENPDWFLQTSGKTKGDHLLSWMSY